LLACWHQFRHSSPCVCLFAVLFHHRHRSALRKKEYGEAAAAYEAALGLNPLYPDVWFSLGYCYLKTGQIQKALQVRRGPAAAAVSCSNAGCSKVSVVG